MDFSTVEAHLASGNVRGAVSALRAEIGYPAVAGATEWRQAARLLSEIGAADVPDLTRSAHRLAASPDDLQHLYDVGYHLFEIGLFDLAAAAFARAEAISAGVPAIVSELVAALEERGRYADASHLLRRHPHLLDHSFLFVYLSAFNAIASGVPDEARALLPRLVPSDENESFMAQRVTRMLARIDHIQPVTGLSTMDLRGWHFALTGGTLLHLSMAGYDHPMRGRYAYVQDSLGVCRAAISQVRDLLEAADQLPRQVVLLPERGSAALGQALAAAWSLPTVEFRPDLPGLVVAYDLDALPMQTQVALRHHRPGQILWAHATCWTRPPICVPDISTYLYQVNTAPWELQLDATSPEPEVQGGADRIAAAIQAAPPIDEDALPEQRAPLWAALAQAREAAAPAFRQEAGIRERLWFMGPVHSNHF